MVSDWRFGVSTSSMTEVPTGTVTALPSIGTRPLDHVPGSLHKRQRFEGTGETALASKPAGVQRAAGDDALAINVQFLLEVALLELVLEGVGVEPIGAGVLPLVVLRTLVLTQISGTCGHVRFGSRVLLTIPVRFCDGNSACADAKLRFLANS